MASHRFTPVPAVLALIALAVVGSAARAQSDVLLELQSGSPETNRFRVDSTGAVVMQGAFNAGGHPAPGVGTRLIWYPGKAAFRAGSTSALQWNIIGDYSFAAGHNTVATGNASTSVGSGTTASGWYSFASGIGGNASGTAASVLGSSSVASALASTAIGSLSSASGEAATAIGSFSSASGAVATAIGRIAFATGNFSTAVGHRVTAAGLGTMALGNRARAQHTGAFVWGDFNTESAEDSVVSQANREFRARARGGFRLRTTLAANAAPGVSGNNGCDLSTGGGSWVCGSSRTLKENFLAVDGEELLRRVRATPVSSWNYVEEEGRPRHLGPMAEDFHQAFGLGDTPTGIGHLDIAGVTFAGVQALEVRTAEQAEAIRALSAENAALRNRLARLERLMEGLLDPP
jgi:trimeric autotransporter adhesin